MISIWFDGGCGPQNPGGRATCGFVVYDDNNNRLGSGSRIVGSGPSMSNNVAEYYGILDAMRWVEINYPNAQVTYYGDSALVIKQMNGEMRIKRGLYKPVALEAKALSEKHNNWYYKWTPREDNMEADALTRI